MIIKEESTLPEVYKTDDYITSNQWMFSCRCLTKDRKRDFVAVKEKTVTIEKETNKVVHTEDAINIIEQPKRRVWVTQPKLRTYKDKKESELISNCDVYTVRDSDMVDELKRIMRIRSDAWMSLRRLCNSPYIYGADVSMECLIRIWYKNQMKHSVMHFTTGGFDIEQSVLGCNRINVATIVLGKDVYTGVLRDFVSHNVDSSGNQYTPTFGEMEAFNAETVRPYLEQYHFHLHMQIFDTELELLNYLFSAMKKHKTDFLSIWNINYDIKEIIKRVEFYNEDFSKLFHNQLIPDKYRYAWYKEDFRKVQHNADKWHWLHTVGFTQPIDSMLNYARIRKQQTREPKYTLDFIANKVLGKGKLTFDDNADHYTMQSKFFKKYIAYNIVDAIILELMNMKTNDHAGLVELSGVSPLSDYSKQTTMLKDQYYEYYLSVGRVLGTAPEKNEELHAKYLSKLGGTVLPPYLIKDVGVRALRDHPSIETWSYTENYDEDFASIYPYVKISHNISKDTKRSSIVSVGGRRDTKDIEKLFGGLATPIENTVPICKQFFGLPGYDEMEQLIDAHLKLRYDMSTKKGA